MGATTVAECQAVAEGVAAAVRKGLVRDKESLHKAKQAAARSLGILGLPTDPDLVPHLPEDVALSHGHLFRKKPQRSLSGVAVVAVMSSPAACPHGKCVYCPGGPDVDAPQSYTGFEPSTMRARQFNYDSAAIVRHRLAALEANGHAIDKVDVVVQGGTFPARDQAYRDWFIAGIYHGLNEGPAADGGEPFDAEWKWRLMSPEARASRLLELQRRNEAARCRCVGLTIETKPDWCLEEHVDEMLRYGATRVELGLQALDDDVLALTHRGHTLEDSRRAMAIVRDAGLKVCVHMMPGQPRRRSRRGGPGRTEGAEGALATPEQRRARSLGGPGRTGGAGGALAMPAGSEAASPATTPGDGAAPICETTVFETDEEEDQRDIEQLFADPAWRPDYLKVYPTLVVQEGETALKRWWQEGRYTPYDTATAARVIAGAKPHVAEYCRIQRIDRDIPTTHVDAGVQNSNLRQYVQREMEAAGTSCRCLRCREVGQRVRAGAIVDPDRLVLVRRDYEAGGGLEAFLSFEDPEADAVAAYLRLRRASTEAHRAEVKGAGGPVALVREVKVPGVAQPIGAHGEDGATWQHRGLGSRLLLEAERVAGQWGCQQVVIMAGVGVRPYYRDRGYIDAGPYVARQLP